MLKAEAVCRVIRSETKYYLMLKPSYEYGVCCFKTKLRPRFIGSSTVMAKKTIAYTFDLLRKLRTHHLFNVGMLKPYRNPNHVSSRRER